MHSGLTIWPDSTTEIFTVGNNSSGVIRYQDSWGPSRISISSEGGASSESNLVKGYHTLVAPYIFKQKMSTTWENVRWGKYDEIKNLAGDLGKATIETINALGAGITINAQNTSYTCYGDALPLGSTVHTRPDGGSSQSNASATSLPLTEPNLETGMIAIKQQKSGSGQKMNIGNHNLVLQVQEAQEKEAIIITGSQKKSGVNTNDMNWYIGKINVYVNPFIGTDFTDIDGNAGSDKQWSLLAKGVTGLDFIYDTRPVYKNWQDEDTDTMYTKVYMSARAIWKHWYATWFSKGDETAYAS